MQILWHGQSFFEISAKGEGAELVRIALDPFGDKIGLKVPKAEADILLVSHSHEDHNNIEAIKGAPFLIDSPGEYEVKGIFVKGISAFHDNQQGKDRGVVVIYRIEAEGMVVCHLSDLGQKELTPEQVEEIGEVDILMMPVGGTFTVDAKDASEIISQIEPRMVIPMHYKIPGLTVDLNPVDKFLKEMGEEGIKPEPKLKVSLKDLPQEETKIVVLEP